MADRIKYKRTIVSNDAIRLQKQRKKVRRTVFYVFLFIVANITFISAAFLVLMKVRNINIEGNARYTSDEILESLNIDLGENMYNFKSSDLETEIKINFPYISDVQIRRKLPSTLELSVMEKQPALYMKLNGEVFILSSDLLVLEMTKDEKKINGLTELITGNLKRCIVGERIMFRDNSTFDLLDILNQSIYTQFKNSEITEIDITSRFDIWLRYKDSFTVFVGNTENCELKMKFLKRIISQLDNGKRGRIDISNVSKGAFKEGELIKTT